jgi:hypothetical protein
MLEHRRSPKLSAVRDPAASGRLPHTGHERT